MALTVAQLSKQIKSEIKKVYLFYGEEAYLHSFYIGEIKERVLTGPFSDFNYSVFEEKDASFEDFRMQLDTYPQMAEKKLIVLKNTDFLTSAEHQKRMEKLLESLPDYAVVIFSEQDVKKVKKSLLSIIESKGAAAEFSKQKTPDLCAWVGRELAKAGKRIKNQDAEHLVNICDRSLDRLKTECDKLVAAAGEDEVITGKLIDDMVQVPLEFKIYSMADKLLSGDDKGAYIMLREFKLNKEQPVIIISLIYSQLSSLLMFRQIKQRGADFLAPNRKFLARRLAGESMRHDEKKLRAAMQKCALYEDEIKSGRIEGWTALELIMAYLLS